MHRNQLREIVRDVDVVCAIAPIVQKYNLTVEATTQLLEQLSVPRAGYVARVVGQSV
jgi:hypothetical protein